MLTSTGTYDEALERFHRTGPEFEGWLSNHGPMVVEALARLGHERQVHGWTDGYLRRLEDAPRGIDAITHASWRDALGDPTRAGDWIAFFLQEAEAQPWPVLLTQWWPRLLPGIAAGATHGVIRVGHAVRALRALETPPRRRELAHALAYWAARWQPLPLVTQGWARTREPLARPGSEAEVPAALDGLVAAVLAHYADHAHGNPTMLVHAATAPRAVANTLPSLPRALWLSAFDAAWSASSAVLAAYSPRDARPARHPGSLEDALEQAVAHGGEHVVKLADTAAASYTVTGDDRALAAVLTAVDLDA